MAASSRQIRGLFTPAFVLGFAFAGLFDGILLHQLLQWHHLLSLVEGEGLQDLRVQVFADGAFHALMYLLAAAGLWLLWRRREALGRPESGRPFIGALALGFGAWNLVDAVLFHWVLRLHHIRLDPDEALISDVLWLVVFGAIPLVAGWRLWSGGGKGPSRRSGPTAVVSSLVAMAMVLGAGAVSLAPGREPTTAVLFRPDLSSPAVMTAVAAVDARLVWADRSGQLVVVRLARQGDRWALYRHGALLVGGAGPAGCLAWARPA